MLSSPCQVLLGFDLLHVDAHRPAQAPIRMPGYRSSLSCSASCNGSSLEESRKGRRTEGSVSWLPLFTSTISQSTKKHMIIHIFLHLILSQQQPSKNNWWAPVCWVPVKKKTKKQRGYGNTWTSSSGISRKLYSYPLLLHCSETWGKFLSLSFLIYEMSGHLLLPCYF